MVSVLYTKLADQCVARDHFDRKQEERWMPQKIERRKQRSTDPIIALHYQLQTVRAEASLDALVLVDDAGCLVAGAGAWPVCEELAAFAPFLADGTSVRNRDVASQAAELARHTHVQPMCVDGLDVVLCAKGGSGSNLASQVSRAADGCRRILTTGP